MPSGVYYLTEHKDTKTQSFSEHRDAETQRLFFFVSLCLCVPLKNTTAVANSCVPSVASGKAESSLFTFHFYLSLCLCVPLI